MSKVKYSAIGRRAGPRTRPDRRLGLVFLFVALALLGLSAQENGFRLLWKLPLEARFFTTDKLQQVYVVTPTNEVIKYSPDGNELFRYNNNTLGRLGHIDATNPFNLLLYYPDFQVAITLDRTMNPISELNLWNLGVGNVQTVGMARDNNLWVYDNAAFQLLRFDKEGNELARSDNLNLLLGVSPEPETLLSRNNLVYANDPDLGILLFDDFAQYVRTLPLSGLRDVQIFEYRLVGSQDGALLLFDLETLTEQRLAPPGAEAGVLQMEMQKDRLYVLGGEGLSVFVSRGSAQDRE